MERVMTRLNIGPVVVMAVIMLLSTWSPAIPAQRSGAYAGDREITAQVEAAIRRDPALRVMSIEVSTYQNVVVLSGSVDRPQMLGLAGRVANDIAGVASVQNDLIVK
jgi:hyperosmotically inducible periplasmic protein